MCVAINTLCYHTHFTTMVQILAFGVPRRPRCEMFSSFPRHFNRPSPFCGGLPPRDNNSSNKTKIDSNNGDGTRHVANRQIFLIRGRRNRSAKHFYSFQRIRAAQQLRLALQPEPIKLNWFKVIHLWAICWLFFCCYSVPGTKGRVFIGTIGKRMGAWCNWKSWKAFFQL